MPTPAAALAEGGSVWIPALSAVGAGFAIGLAAIGLGMGQGIASGRCIDGTSRQPEMVMTMPGTDPRMPEFLAINPFHAVPIIKDDGQNWAATGAILRYLAEKHAHDFYPPSPQRRGFVDWATDRFATTMYTDAYQCLCPVFGSLQRTRPRLVRTACGS